MGELANRVKKLRSHRSERAVAATVAAVADLEDRHAALLVAVTTMIKDTPAANNYVGACRVVGIQNVELHRQKNGDADMVLRVAGMGHTQRLMAVFVAPGGSHPNPELLERASTLLAEAYIAAQKETK